MSSETKVIALALIFSLVGGVAAGAMTNTVLYFTAGGYVDAAYNQAFNLFNSAVIRCSSQYIDEAMVIEIDQEIYYCQAYKIDWELGKDTLLGTGYGVQAPGSDINSMLPV